MAVTELKLIKCHGADRFVQMSNDAIAMGYQPQGKLIEFEDGDLGVIMFMGTPDGGGGGGGPISPGDITGITTVGTELLTAEDAGAALTSIGAASDSDLQNLTQRVQALEEAASEA